MGPLAKIETKGESKTRQRRGSMPEIKTSSATGASNLASTTSSAEKKVPTGPRANPLYKTRLCMNFQSTGSCPYTEKCQFAHGVAELEKWESWRSNHKTDENDRKEMNPLTESSPTLNPASSSSIDGRRSRAHSEETHPREERSHSDFSDFTGSMISWDLNTPMKPTMMSREEPISNPSSPSTFSYWSKFLGELDERPDEAVTAPRERASTFDNSPTYDNMSQLRDAPTLFSVPPILSNFKRMSL